MQLASGVLVLLFYHLASDIAQSCKKMVSRLCVYIRLLAHWIKNCAFETKASLWAFSSVILCPQFQACYAVKGTEFGHDSSVSISTLQAMIHILL